MKQLDQIEQSLHNLVSPKRSHTFRGLLFVLLAAGMLLWAKHGVWLTHPNDTILFDTPDGFKNYMTAAWHVAHDSSYVHYGGMDYPFGEHVLFTDNQPIFCAAMQWWNWHISDIHGDTTGIINIFQVLSMLLGAGVIYLLLRKLHLPAWYAAIAALGILFLSPQNNRFYGHFGLSHTWVFPLLLLLLCRYEERSSRRYQSLLIGLLLFVAAQLHFYYFGVSALFLGIYTAYQMLADFRWPVVLKRIYHLVVMVVVPFVLLNIWVHWSDYCSDRPASPFGFTTYIGYWEGVFLPYENFPMYQWIDRNIIKIRRLDSAESQAYAGVVAFAFTLWLLFRRRFRAFDKEWDEAASHRVHKRYLNGVLVTGFAMLLLGCGFPFAIPGMEWTVDYLGPFKQFRGLGRFIWTFYYAINMLAFYVLWNKSSHYPVTQSLREAFDEIKLKLRRRDFKNLPLAHLKKWALVVIPLLILCWEAWFYQHSKILQLSPNPTLRSTVDTPTDDWFDKVDFSRYQALMPLPYYHVGSENIWLDIYYPLFKKTQETAFQTGVPDMGVFMSRSSIGRMVKSMQWALEPGEKPEILGEFPDNRPIALMIEPAKWEEVKTQYAHLLAKAQPVYDGPDLKIMSLVPDSMRVYAQEHTQAVLREAAAAQKPLHNGWKSVDPNGCWMYNENYDSLTNTQYRFQGAGAATGIMSDTTWLYQGVMPPGDYNLSLWVNVTEDMGMAHEAKIIQNSLADGHQIEFRHEGLRFYLRSIVHGWALFDVPFKVHEGNSRTSIFLWKKGADMPFWFDEVMIKSSKPTIYKQMPGWVAKDNMWFRL